MDYPSMFEGEAKQSILLNPVNISIHTLLMSRTPDHYELVNQGQSVLFQPSTLL